MSIECFAWFSIEFSGVLVRMIRKSFVDDEIVPESFNVRMSQIEICNSTKYTTIRDGEFMTTDLVHKVASAFLLCETIKNIVKRKVVVSESWTQYFLQASYGIQYLE
jgi:hypothetical protein